MRCPHDTSGEVTQANQSNRAHEYLEIVVVTAIVSQGDVNGDSINLDLDDINVGGVATLIASADNDVIEIGDSHFASRTTVLLGFGDNLIDLDVTSDANDFNGRLTLSGMLGSDTYDASDTNSFSVPPDLNAMEEVG